MSTNSRDADKFVVRLPDGVRDQVQERAKPLYISMNSWILQAIDEKLDREHRAERAVDALVGGYETIGKPLLTALLDIRHLPAEVSESLVGDYAVRIAKQAIDNHSGR